MDRLSSLLTLFNPKAEQVVPFSLTTDACIGGTEAGASSLYVAGEQALTLEMAGVVITLAPHDIVWLPTGAGHRLRAVEEGDGVMARIRMGALHHNPLFLSLPDYVVIEGGGRRPDLQPLIQLMLVEANQARCAHTMALDRLCEVLMIHLLRHIITDMTVEQGVIAGLGDKRLAKALTAVHDAPDQAWSIETLAQQAGMSRTAFSLHFKAVVGTPPGEYLKQWRMRLAHHWLEDDSITISIIAERLGYQSEAAFRRVFRQVMGVPPGAVRRQALMP